MPYDYSQATIPVYSGINDLVIPPNSTKGGNGAHLIQQINRIAENLNTDFNQLSNQVSTVEQSQQQLAGLRQTSQRDRLPPPSNSGFYVDIPFFR